MVENVEANKGIVIMNSTVHIADGVTLTFARNSGADTTAAFFNNVFLSDGDAKTGKIAEAIYGAKPNYEVRDVNGDMVIGWMARTTPMPLRRHLSIRPNVLKALVRSPTATSTASILVAMLSLIVAGILQISNSRPLPASGIFLRMKQNSMRLLTLLRSRFLLSRWLRRNLLAESL